MKQENTKHKIKKIWENSQQIKEKVKIENIKLKKINDNFLITNLSFANKVYNFSTEWETLEAIQITGYFHEFLKEWTIVFEKLPIQLIPFINYTVLFKHPSNISFEEKLEGAHKELNHIFQIEDLSKNYNENIKKVSLIVCCQLTPDRTFGVFNPQNTIETKLSVTLSCLKEIT